MGYLQKKGTSGVIFFETFNQPFKTVNVLTVDDHAVDPGKGSFYDGRSFDLNTTPVSLCKLYIAVNGTLRRLAAVFAVIRFHCLGKETVRYGFVANLQRFKKYRIKNFRH